MEGKEELKFIFLLGTFVLVLLVLGLFFLAVIYQKYFAKLKHKQLISNLEKQALNQKLLLSQMNPHFIFNSIDNIKSLIHNEKDDEAIKYLTKFSKLTRQILENSAEDYISLKEEVAMLENYIAIQQLLYNQNFMSIINLNFENKIDAENIFLPPMLTQPFIENAIKHGLRNREEKGKVTVNFYMKENRLYFEVSDNGGGFENTEKHDNHKSMAIKITRERLVHYTKNKDFTVHTDNIIDKNQNTVGAKITFEIPYIHEN